MTAPTRLKGLQREEFGRPVKALLPATSASLGLGTSYADFINYTGGVEDSSKTGAWMDIGNAPGIDVTIAFTHGATPTTFTLLAVEAVTTTGDYTADPTIGAPPPYIPTAAATGVTPAYVNEVTFTKTDWSTTTSPLSSSSVKYLKAYLKVPNSRLVKLMGKADSATNSPTAIVYVTPGTAE